MRHPNLVIASAAEAKLAEGNQSISEAGLPRPLRGLAMTKVGEV